MKHLNHVHLAVTQCGDVLGHRPRGRARDRFRCDSGESEIVLQADPGRGHFAYRGDPPAHQILHAERGIGGAPDQKKRIAAHDLAESDAARVGILVARGHQPHRPAPGHIGTALSQCLQGIAERRRRFQLDVEAFGFVRPQRERRVERGIEERPKVFEETDFHRRSRD